MNTEISNTNPLLCDPETGLCEIPGNDAKDTTTIMTQSKEKQVRVVYFTDPICSSCWGIEPQLRKLKLEYGEDIAMEYRMGGLLPDWSYNSGGINKPDDVAHHWDEMSVYYDMPIDGDIWLEDPLHSSYPPSIAFKAAQLQDEAKAILFLREVREMVFLKRRNIAKWEYIASAAMNVGLNVEQLKTDMEGKAKTWFEEDLKLAREFGVRGFPTMFFMDSSGNKEMVYGSRPYAFYETAILKIQPAVVKREYKKDWETLFTKYPSLTAREFVELSGTPRNESEKLLNELTKNGKLEKLTTKNGALWRRKSTSS
ncbi:DsbA family protein [Mariniphaga sediminis]|uniref:DsbA family protein n=1 Tax=Mariniphaga sediminis TaxID=1628158 RepID=A0A399D9S5_9BACT|nr:ClpXP adapter SpxH family protein [Mariniphaga sediminis]RIH66840.1 DsbA family protein [Mariniphaga sediminis]